MDTTTPTNQPTANNNTKRTRCEVWTRVMGYHRPLSHFNIGKKSEHISRKHFLECITANTAFIQQFAPVANNCSVA